jgi:hypothetical protein
MERARERPLSPLLLPPQPSCQYPDDGRLRAAMLLELIAEYLIAIGGPDRGTWRLWLAVSGIGTLACVLLIVFRVS